MMFSKPPHTPCRAGGLSRLARAPRTAWFRLLIALACALLFATACKRSEPALPQKPVTADETKADPSSTKADLDKLALEREAFGLPLPPDAAHVLRAMAYVTAYSDMKLDELEAFYKGRLVDYEYIYPSKYELHIVGLRAYLPQINIRHSGGKFGKAKLSFRPGLDPPPSQEPNPEQADGQIENSPTGDSGNTHALHRRREKGMPVLDRNASGELIAPGARWGEPYTPPEGTPLHRIRNKENFGRPYGEWQMP